MDSHDGTDIPRQIPAAGRDGQILDGIQTVGIDHEIAVVLIDGRRLASVPAIKELGESLLLNRMDGVHVEPCRVTGEDDGVSLRDEV